MRPYRHGAQCHKVHEMKSDWLDRYFAAWARLAQAADPRSGTQEMARFLSFMADDVRYEDVPSGAVFIGHDGVRAMAAAAYAFSADLDIECVSAQMSGDQFAFECEAHGTNTGALGPIPASGKRFTLRSAAIGRISADGKVVLHKDYWDMAGFLAQIGLMPRT
jgi:steroid delta-isomerase-like uncharacterized protein